jgi:5'-nucleotidase/UDP-sugar diphosphatase
VTRVTGQGSWVKERHNAVQGSQPVKGEKMVERLHKSIFLFLVIALVFCSGLLAGEADSRLTILHVNDYHGRMLPSIDKQIDPKKEVGGAAYLAAMIKEERAKNPGGTLLLAAGDMFQGSPESNLSHGAPVIEIMNELKFDAMALGNHEFDWGMAALTRLRKTAQFPFLAANIVDSRGNLLPGIRPYRILQRRHAKVAVIGLTTPETAYTTKPDNVRQLTFLSAATVLPRLIQQVREQGASTVIVLSHMGLDADKDLASSVPGIDVIVGGHSHTEVTKPLKMENGTVIVQAGAYGVYLGVLELNLDPNTGRPTGHTDKSGLKLISAGPQDRFDRKTALIVKKYEDRIKPKLAVVVGETSVDLMTRRDKESNLGNLIADSMRESTRKQAASQRKQIAFQNSGGIRTDIPSGKITMRQMYTVLPFDNKLVYMDLTGEQVREVLEQGGSGEFGLLQVSGITVTYDLKKPVGKRLVKADVEGEALDPRGLYTIVTNDFLAAGGDKVTALKEARVVEYGDTLRDALIHYLNKHSPVAPKIEGRILFVQ